MRLRAWFILSALFWASALHAQELSCRVVALSDGDTFTCLDAFKTQHKVRLANIDTPEKDQPYRAKSKQILSGLIFAKQVVVDAQTKDRYGRTIALVTTEGLNVNREMVERGAAWVYPHYNQDPSLPGLERQAQAASRGIWGLPKAQIIAPWEWRKLWRSLNSEFSTRNSRLKARQQPLQVPAASVCAGK